MAGSLMLLAAALVALGGMLRDIDLDQVVAAIRATPLHAALGACALVSIGYGTLAFYDYVALRAVGRREVPYAVAAFAGFTASAIGSGLGAGLLSGGAVRFRIYSPWGLGLVEVTKIGFITGLTFWLGTLSALGLGFALALAPEQAATQRNSRTGPIRRWGSSRFSAWLDTSPG